MQRGQAGVPWRGEMAKCWPFAGSAGKCGIKATGLLPSDLSKANIPPDVINFYARCRAGNRGFSTKIGIKLNYCACSAYYGPDITYINASSLLPATATTILQLTPCFCPAWAPSPLTATSSSPLPFILNGITYTNQTTKYSICGSATHGSCSTVSDALPSGTCACVDGWQGDACSCAAALPSQDGYVVNAPGPNSKYPCSNQGVCSSGVPCACDNGWTGPACVCPSPKDLVSRGILGVGRQQITNGFGTQVSISVPVQIGRIRVLQCPGLQNVTVVTTIAPTVRTICSADPIIPNEWVCPDGVFVSMIYAATTPTLTWLPCDIKAFTSTEPATPCGPTSQTNPTAARLLTNLVWPASVLEGFRSTMFGPFGCTTGNCQCSNNYGGPHCGWAISKIDPDTKAQGFCGQSTLSSRGIPL